MGLGRSGTLKIAAAHFDVGNGEIVEHQMLRILSIFSVSRSESDLQKSGFGSSSSVSKLKSRSLFEKRDLTSDINSLRGEVVGSGFGHSSSRPVPERVG